MGIRLRESSRRSKFAVAVVAVAIVFASGSAAIAAIPAKGTGVITGCYNTTTGALRVIDTKNQTCGTGEKSLSWNQRGMNWRGAWSASTAYKANDAVLYAGSSYIAVANNQGAQPDTSIASWSLLASAGAQGAQGDPGAQGPPGVQGIQGPPGLPGLPGVTASAYATKDMSPNIALTGTDMTVISSATDGSNLVVTQSSRVFVHATIDISWLPGDAGFGIAMRTAGQCRLQWRSGSTTLTFGNGSYWGQYWYSDSGFRSDIEVPLTATVDVAPGTFAFEVVCHLITGSIGGSTTADNGDLTAIAVTH